MSNKNNSPISIRLPTEILENVKKMQKKYYQRTMTGMLLMIIEKWFEYEAEKQKTN